MNDVLNFTLPTGYRVRSGEGYPSVECERGCGWKLRVATVSGLSTEAREQLFRCHDSWHCKQR